MDNMDILLNIYSSSMNNYVYGMGDTTVEDIKDFTEYVLENIINDNDLDIQILELSLNDSKVNKNPHKDADLNIILYYSGSISENNLYTILHLDKYYDKLIYDGVYIDINPILDEWNKKGEFYKFSFCSPFNNSFSLFLT